MVLPVAWDNAHTHTAHLIAAYCLITLQQVKRNVAVYKDIAFRSVHSHGFSIGGKRYATLGTFMLKDCFVIYTLHGSELDMRTNLTDQLTTSVNILTRRRRVCIARYACKSAERVLRLKRIHQRLELRDAVIDRSLIQPYLPSICRSRRLGGVIVYQGEEDTILSMHDVISLVGNSLLPVALVCDEGIT